MQPKKLGHTTILGEQGVNLLAKRVMEMGFVWYPTGSVEAGIDGHIELRDEATGEVFNTILGAQSKATSGDFANETSERFDYYCDPRDLDYWLKGNLPVIVVVSRPSTDEAYWVSVKSYFQDPARRSTNKITFDKRSDRFDRGARLALFDLGASKAAGIYLAAPRKREALIGNLLPVAFLPQRLYLADTDLADGRAVVAECRRAGVQIGGEWIVRNKRILGFRDLTRPEWAPVCDRGSVEDFAIDEWANTEDPARRTDFVDLLRRTLREMLREILSYHEKLELLYFRPTDDLSSREVDYQGLAKSTDRTVFRAYVGEDGAVKYYRHSAFHERFHRFDGHWYLEITPTYHFTSDGYRLRPGYQRFLKRIKEIEGHEAVRGQLIMWSTVLTPRADLFHTDPYPFLGFGDLVRFECQCGIEDEAWSADRAASNANRRVQETVQVGTQTIQMFAP